VFDTQKKINVIELKKLYPFIFLSFDTKMYQCSDIKKYLTLHRIKNLVVLMISCIKMTCDCYF